MPKIIALLLISLPLLCQTTRPPGPVRSWVYLTGKPSTGHCAQFSINGAGLGDSGAPCGAPQVLADWNATTGMGVIKNKPPAANIGLMNVPGGLVGIGMDGNVNLSGTLAVGNTDPSVILPKMFNGTWDDGSTNPAGRFQIYTALGTFPLPGAPLGADLVLEAKGPADLRLKTTALKLTSTTTVAAGSHVIQVADTSKLYTLGADIIIDAGTLSEENIIPANWSVSSGSSITAIFIKSHTQPFEVAQYGSFMATGHDLLVLGDTAYPFLAIKDKNNSRYIYFPSDVSASWPNNGIGYGTPIRGTNGVNGDLYVRSTTAASNIIFQSNTGTTIASLDNSGVLNAAAVIGGSVVVGSPLRTQHIGAATPTGGSSGDFKIGTGKIWMNDAGTWTATTPIPATATFLKGDGLGNAVASIITDDGSNLTVTARTFNAPAVVATGVVVGAPIRTQHIGAVVPTGGSPGDIKIANGKIWVNDAGTWKSVTVN